MTKFYSLGTQAVTALAVYENYLLLGRKYNKLGIHSHASNTLSCPFDWNEIVVKKSCDLHPKLQIPNADSYLTSIVIKDNHLHTSDNYGNFYNCSLKEIEDECLLQENFNGTISGMDMNSINLYIAFESGKLLRCPLNSNLMASCKELYDDAYYWLGLTAVHVAYDALWLGTKNGQLLKCPLNNEFKESKLNCQEFAKMNWSWYTKPVVYNIQSKNGFLLAGWKGFTVNEMWRCDPDDAQKCGNIKFELPSRTRTFVIVD